MESEVWGAYQQGSQNVLAVLPTGGGKTFILSRIASAIAAQGHAVAASAHRAELVSQMSTALAREGVRHRVIGPAGLTRACTAIHMTLFKRSYVDPNALVGVCSVDTLVNMDAGNPWFRRVRLWIQDEAHHVLKDNKWGKACQLFPHAWGLGVTATPLRADGKGLGRHADGLFDTMVVGPYMRELIDAGYLCDYVIKQPPSNIDLSSVPITDSGDFSPEKLRAARRRSTITGDVVQHYLKWANGKLGVTFDTDIESATETAAAFKAAGIPAEVVTSKTPDLLREDIKRRFAARHVLQLVNVDLFGEGYDLPAIEVVSMARPTESYGLYVQQFGRALRRMEGKDRALILDHVGNVIRHGGPPDVPREWTLDRRERRSRGKAEGVIPLRTCLNPECLQPYERVYRACPYCGFEPVVADRSAPEKVDGDLVDLDPAVLDQIRAEIARIKGAPSYSGVPRIAWDSYTEKHEARAKAQQELVDAMALWGGWQTLLGRSVSEGQRRFFFTFGVDVATAQTLGRPEAEALTERIRQHLLVANVQPVGSQ